MSGRVEGAPGGIGLDDQTIDDADELHFGAQYVFLEATPVIAVRLGAWLDPDHQMYATVADVDAVANVH